MEELVRKAISGEEEAFNELIIYLQKDLYKIARMRLNCEDDINDAVQETIIQAYKNLKKVKKPKYFKTWIIKILINNCNKIYRKLHNKKIIEYEEEILDTTYSISNSESIENLDFYILIKNLDYKERITLILYYLLEFTTKEIGSVLKEPDSTIRNRISRTRKKLKTLLEGGNVNGRVRL